MLSKLSLLARTRSDAYRAAGGTVTTDPLVTEEIEISPASYEELIRAEEAWENYAMGKADLPKIPGVAVANHNTLYHMVFIGTFQISIVVNEMTVRRSGPDGVIQYDPHTLAKVMIHDYAMHPERIVEYFTKNDSSWSMEQFTLGYGLAYLNATLKAVADKQPKAPEPTLGKEYADIVEKL